MERCEALLAANDEQAATSRDLANAPLVGRASLVIARLSFCLFILVTSTYCLLAYIPFTYQWVISFNLVSWLPAFVGFHPYLYWLVLGMVAATLARDIKRHQTRRLAAGFLVFHAAVGAGLLFRPVLPGIQNDGVSLVWSLVWLFPLLWLAAIDFAGEYSEVSWTAVAKRDGHLTLAVLMTAVFVSSLNVALFIFRQVAGDGGDFKWPEQLVAASWGVGSQLFLFALLFIALKVINFISTKFTTGAKVEYLLCQVLAMASCALLIRKVLLPSLAFNNQLADVFSWVAAGSIVAFLMGLGLRLRRQRKVEVSGGLQLALAPVTLPGLSSTAGVVVWSVLVALFAWTVPATVALKDWDFLLQKLSAVAIWPIGFAASYRIVSRTRNRRYPLALLLLLGAASAYRSVDWWVLRVGIFGGDNFDVSATLERYSSYDPSFKVVRELFAESTDDGDFYEYLRTYTNILPSTRVAPVEVNLVERLKRAEGDRPNIFIFVVDSLRRDYLSPYNQAVNFTPNIERFARESVVMENAFTRYGGTALSEPAIWAGSMLLHKQYVLPFYPMNSLQKLLDVDEYQSFISMDPILRALLRPADAIVDLDRRPDDHNFDFCWSLKELEKKIDERQTSRPLFAYSQPWNIHTHVIAVEGRTVVEGEEYPGFWAPYASRVKYMDACLGQFVDYLKARGYYDNSVIILTSDHGDSLGEGGRWGHSYWMYPEIMRIPLIVHLPARLQRSLTWNTSSVAFSTDITPSLYYLLGHHPIVKNPLFGRPLFTLTEREQRDYLQDSYVIASSYGAAYGAVSGNGRWMFVADGVNNKDYFSDLGGEVNGRLSHFTAATREAERSLIREYIASQNQFYGLSEKPQTAGAFDMGWQGRAARER